MRFALCLFAVAAVFALAAAQTAPSGALAVRDESEHRLVTRRRHRHHKHHHHKKSHHKHHKSHKSHSFSTSKAIKGQSVPKALASFAKKAFAANKCEHQLDTQRSGFQDGVFKNQHYCGSSKKDPEFVWWTSNMDVDNPDGQSQTAATFKGKFLDAAEVPYVVINQQGTFDFTHFGIELMSAVTVVCNGKMFAAVIGDTNGESQMGEASIGLAKACFPRDDVNGNSAPGGEVLYMVHTGVGAVIDSLNPAQIAAHASSLLSKLHL